jgi:hypothetical protein
MTPAPDSIAREFKKALLGNWLDFRAYLGQRKRLLREPELCLSKKQPSEPNWKGPLAFAIQGTVLVTLLLNSVDYCFRKLSPPSQTHEARLIAERAQIDRDLEEIKAHPKVIEPSTVFFGDPLEDIADRKQKLAAAEQRLRWSDAGGVVEKFAVPASLLFSAYVFRWFLQRIRKASSIPAVAEADRVYLYCITGGMFWSNTAVALAMTALFDIDRYYPGTLDGYGGPLSVGCDIIVVFGLFSYVTSELVLNRLERLFRGEDSISRPTLEKAWKISSLLGGVAYVVLGAILSVAYITAG